MTEKLKKKQFKLGKTESGVRLSVLDEALPPDKRD